jgi:hypothetical protein
MNLHLAEIATEVAPGKVTAAVVDQAPGGTRPASRFRTTSRMK